MKNGYSTYQPVFGRSPHIPSIHNDEQNYVTELEFQSESEELDENLRAMRKAREIHMRQESDERIKLALKKNVREHKLEEALIGDKIVEENEGEEVLRHYEGKSVERGERREEEREEENEEKEEKIEGEIIPKVKREERWRMVKKETGESIKETSARSYNIENLEDGKVTGNGEEVIEAKLKELKSWKENNVYEK
ncbi:DNA transposase THAP9 [Armadillidium vulgare]|nr:DNA transposase THAP9 [Armadillidium vulgare]